LKIAMLSIHSCPLGRVGEENTGGMSVCIRELARELGRRGHFVDVYTRLHEPIHDRVVGLGKNARLIHLEAGEGEIPKLAIYDHLGGFTRDLEEFGEENGLRYDLIHSHYWLSGLVGRRLAQKWGVPHMVRFHTLAAVKNAIGIGEDEPELRIHAEKGLVRDCHRLIASTEKEKEDLLFYYDAAPEKICVIPCGVNLDLFRPIQREIARTYLDLDGERIILFVGRIIPLKGIGNLLKALTYLEEGRKTKLLVVGGSDTSEVELERLKSLSQTLKVNESVLFHGLVEQERLPFFYSAADLCVVPSYHESFGLVILESLACGTPVVATNVGVAESVIRQGETGYIVTKNDSCRLAEKIGQLLSVSNGKNELADSVRASVTKYSWSNIADAVLEEYRKALKDFPGKPRRESTSVSGLIGSP
jgi:D-inositol-3-phosphate glycosyltransferase